MKEKNKELIAEFHPDSDLLFADGFDDAIVGVSSGCGDSRVVYSIQKMMLVLTEDEGLDYLEAQEFLDFNTIFAWVGEKTPIYVDFLQE
jgi:hypothetical protein